MRLLSRLCCGKWHSSLLLPACRYIVRTYVTLNHYCPNALPTSQSDKSLTLSVHKIANDATYSRRNSFSTAAVLSDDSWLSLVDSGEENASTPDTTGSFHSWIHSKTPVAERAKGLDAGLTLGGSKNSVWETRHEVILQEATLRHQIRKALRFVEHDDPRFKDVVLVAIDSEASNLSNFYGHLSKIGVSILDTRNLHQSKEELDPKKLLTGDTNLPSPWQSLVATRHYQVIDYLYQFKRTKASSVPHFLKTFNPCRFGPSTWIHATDVNQLLHRILCDPTQLSAAASFEIDISNTNRNIVLVGHEMRADMLFMKRLHSYPQATANIITIFDTATLFSRYRSPKLRDLLARLGVNLGKKKSSAGLHIAGNDAAYTLTAFLLMATYDFREPDRLLDMLNGKVKAERTIDIPWREHRWHFGGTATMESLGKKLKSLEAAKDGAAN